MIAPIAVTLPERCRRVSALPLLLAALSIGAQEAEAPQTEEGPLRIPDIVITGADAVIIVPPLPILAGGGIPVPPVELAPLPLLLSPDPLLLSIELSAVAEWLPFFLSGVPPLPALDDLGIRYPELDADDADGQDGGGGS